VSISIEILLPEFSQTTIEEAIANLARHKIEFQFDEDDRACDPKLWSGFRPIVITITRLEHTVSFESGFEVDVGLLGSYDDYLEMIEQDAQLKDRLRACTTIVFITVSHDVTAGLAAANSFAAALAESGKGIAIDCEAGNAPDQMQSLSAILQSDYVEEFDEV